VINISDSYSFLFSLFFKKHVLSVYQYLFLYTQDPEK
jgi:hypothetical protein